MAFEDMELTPAESEYFRSKGENSGAVLQENNRSFDTSTSRDRTSGRDRERDYSDPPMASLLASNTC